MNHKLPNTIQKYGHTYYQCLNKCGSYTRRNGGLCLKCYKQFRKDNPHEKPPVGKKSPSELPEVRRNKYKQKTYPCKNCGTQITRQNSLCRVCYDKIRRELGEKKDAENRQRKEAREAEQARKRKPVKLQICPKNPTGGSHVEIITDNIGVCKFCGRKKDYSKLLEPYLPSIGM